ncbi:hypothetical protein F5Y09DRAFT_334071 [Xylaria sp. FL1042]|nr:hypothetical protein F5Y09DRAFT_334071 [Xylaria sp. FL1042]
MGFSFQDIIQRHISDMDTAFRNLIDTIVQKSKLDITLLRVSVVTEDSFHVTLESRLTKTGPGSASITPMSVELCGPSGHFGNVALPAIRTQTFGTDVDVTSQMVEIVDKEALKVFIQSIMRDGAVISLRNGQTSVSALGIGPRNIVFEKEIPLAGMKGPVVSVHTASFLTPNPVASSSTAGTANQGEIPNPTAATSVSGGGKMFFVVFRVANPSPLELSFGTCYFDIEDHEGNTLAELKGRLDIRRKRFDVTFQGSVDKDAAKKLSDAMKVAARLSRRTSILGGEGQAAQPQARLVGKRCAGAGWCDDTVKSIDIPLQNVRALFRVLEVDYEDEPEDKRSSFMKWGEKVLMR